MAGRQEISPEDGHREISPEELREILADHEKWLASKGKEGSRACLRGCDLNSADLTGARLEDADLTNTDLRDADLTNTDLRNVRGLAADRLGGADLTGAQLPLHIAQFRALEYVAEVSRNARVTFFTLLLVCAYAVLTILTTTDHRLISNSASSPMPFTGTDVPIVWFYRIMPALIVAIYLYLLLYLGRLWRRLPALPATFPDGTALTDTVYPWLLNEQIRQYMPQLRLQNQPLYRADIVISNVLAWFIPPGTMIVLWWRYLPRHDLAFTVMHITLIFLALFVGAVLFGLMILTLRREIGPLKSPSRRKPRPVLAIARQPRFFVAPAAVFFLFIIPVSAGVFYGDADRFTDCIEADAKLPLIEEPCIKKAIPNFLKSVGYRAYADLRDEEISGRPATWRNEEDLLQAVRGADLEGQDLRYADARGTFFVKANLESANLEKADLRGADLRQARLSGANLEGAHLEDADLRKAVLVDATLKGAFLNRAKLQEANGRGAHLTGADLTGADLTGAFLTAASLEGALLNRTKLQKAVLTCRERPEKRCADLTGADLTGADLTGADLTGADLTGADLTGARGVTQEQLEAACGDENTILPDELSRYQFNSCPKGDA